MPVTSVVSKWEEGSPIVWTSGFQRKPFEVEGTVLRFERDRLFEYDHSLPIFRSSGVTHAAVTEQGNKTKQELEHSEGSWRMVLNGMKALLEGTSVVSMR
jgi:hypothetical protein